MAKETPELVAKKRRVVNEESYFSAPRNRDDDKLAEQETISQVAYFSAPNVDKVRVVLGKNWDILRRENEGQFLPDPGASFSNDHPPPVIFYNKALIHHKCDPHAIVKEGPETFSLLDCIIEQRFNLTIQTAFPGKKPPGLKQKWAQYVKTGVIVDNGRIEYEPIITANKWFHDHNFHGINPFSPAELSEKQTFGKTFFADYKTYYNERLNSEAFESATGQNKNLQNSLPSIYSFLKFFNNKNLTDSELLALEPILEEAKEYYDRNDTQNSLIYKDLLKKDSLETLLTLYGIVGTDAALPFLGNEKTASKIIEKILTTSFKNIDANSLFSDYFNEYTKLILNDEKLKFDEGHDNNRILALERMMTNLVFSPSVVKSLSEVDQYKKYFPYYAELEFTANLHTPIGNAMRDMFLTKLMSEIVLHNTQKISGANYMIGSNDSWLVGLKYLTPKDVEWNELANPYPEKKFIEYSHEAVYEDLTLTSLSHSPGSLSQINTKKSVNMPVVLEYWLGEDPYDWFSLIENMNPEAEGVYADKQKTTTDDSGFSIEDLRNYVTYFRNDFSEPININSDDNEIFKNLFGIAFYAKIFNIYKDKIRTYEDIIGGVPAYSEDLFYRIEKTRKFDDSEEEVIQNVLIPNTSDLDIVKYVDTQLKYSSIESKHATYKYNVYVHKLVFGSRYKYIWTDGAGTPDTEEIQKVSLPPEDVLEDSKLVGIGIMEEEAGGGMGTSGWTNFSPTANFKTRVEPSILLIEDKIFSTPDIIILDKPPVMPDIDIIPYRAVSNRLKFLMTGATGRFRAKPEIMIEGDEEEFDRIKSAQLSTDGKVEFGSDDAAKSFQIFRTKQKPTTYKDFELYDQITKEVYEEQILPNTKYYYTFRVIDKHGHVSNPTSVFEVELIDEKGAVKPMIRLFDMIPPKNKINTKDCQKYIYLKPTLQQLYFSDTPSVDGIFSNQTKKKRYKMRLTSKSSGKKIDIDFSFRKNFLLE